MCLVYYLLATHEVYMYKSKQNNSFLYGSSVICRNADSSSDNGALEKSM